MINITYLGENLTNRDSKEETEVEIEVIIDLEEIMEVKTEETMVIEIIVMATIMTNSSQGIREEEMRVMKTKIIRITRTMMNNNMRIEEKDLREKKTQRVKRMKMK
jgi:hypothetical protein